MPTTNRSDNSIDNSPSVAQPRVVIVGGGFGGLKVARCLRRSRVDVSLVDRQNYHLFQPLLYQVATGGLSPANIASPLRAILRRQKNCRVLLGNAVGVDLTNKYLQLDDGRIPFDYLVVAVGATHSYFGRDEWEANAPGLKTLQDATRIRRKVYVAFEAAERESDPGLRRQYMTFVVVGGGPTGVELAGALAEIARHTLKNDFRNINPSDARILLVEAGQHVLSHYPEELSVKAERTIAKLGVEVHTRTKVTEVDERHVRLESDSGGSSVATRTVLWAAGVEANPLGRTVAEACGVPCDRIGRVSVTEYLHVAGHPQVFVIGDLAACLDESGKPLPGVAPVAMQQGEYVAESIRQAAQGHSQKTPFRYRDPGSMATIGRAAAVAKIGKREFSGLFAWLMWLIIHLLQIVQFQNRLLILMQWGWNYVTFNRSARLIVGNEPNPESVPAKPKSAVE